MCHDIGRQTMLRSCSMKNAWKSSPANDSKNPVTNENYFGLHPDAQSQGRLFFFFSFLHLTSACHCKVCAILLMTLLVTVHQLSNQAMERADNKVKQ